jgi:hypothetical protein
LEQQAEPNLEQPSKKKCFASRGCAPKKHKRWNPEVAIILGAAAHYRRAKAGCSHDDPHPDDSAQQTGKIYSSLLHIRRVLLLLLRQRRGAAGNDLGTTIKYLRPTTNGAAGSA